MTAVAAGTVYVRKEVYYFERDWVHLEDDRGYRLTPPDAAVLELVYRGESDFALLCERLAELAPESNPAGIAADLTATFRHPRSILELRDPLTIVDPEVIVCDFSLVGGVDSQHLVRSLRRHHRVLYLGRKERVRGPVFQNRSLESSKRTEDHAGWFEFAQWCRSVVRRSPRAILVLCGEVDAILFGDLVPYLDTLILLEPDWPSTTGAVDLLGADWIPEDPFDATRELFYALRFHPDTDLHQLRGTNGSAFAVLHGYALRHAARIACRMIDQPGALERCGRPAEAPAFVHARAMPPRSPARKDRRILALACDLEAGGSKLLPYLALAKRLVERGLVDEVAACQGSGWWNVEIDGAKGTLYLRSEGAPKAGEVVAAAAFTGLLRSMDPVFELFSIGVPTVFVPSARPHPLDGLVDRSAQLPSASPEQVAAALERLLADGNPIARDLTARQEEALGASSAVHLVRDMLARQRELE